MKSVEARIKCINGDCKNFGRVSIIDIDEFSWDIDNIYGEPAKDTFYHIPQQIHCKECFSLCIFEIN